MDCDKLLLAHNGALGDFLTAWPAFWAVRRHFAHLPAYWAGRGERELWLGSLDAQPAPPKLRHAVDSLYTATEWPQSLDNALVVWLGLGRTPCALSHGRLWFIPTLEQGRLSHPTQNARRELAARGVPWDEDWLNAWRARNGRWTPEKAEPSRILLFPGAGHRCKQWPLARFVALADRLAAQGWRPVFVLGPVELERGLDPRSLTPSAPAWELEPCERLPRLVELLLRAAGVLACDSGPLHLAGCLGTPSLGLYGPTSEAQWASPSGRTLSLALDCRPCSSTTQELHCPAPRCLEELGVDRVERVLLETVREAWVGKTKPAHETAP